MSSICRINVIEPLVEKIFNLTCDGLTYFASITLKECAALDALIDSMSHNYRPSPIALPVSNTKLLPSIVQALKLELKELPSLLKYIYLGNPFGHNIQQVNPQGRRKIDRDVERVQGSNRLDDH